MYCVKREQEVHEMIMHSYENTTWLSKVANEVLPRMYEACNNYIQYTHKKFHLLVRFSCVVKEASRGSMPVTSKV